MKRSGIQEIATWLILDAIGFRAVVTFFTATLRDRQSTWRVDHIALLRQAVRLIRPSRPFALDAIVALPDHLHTLWTLPPGDDDYSARWRFDRCA